MDKEKFKKVEKIRKKLEKFKASTKRHKCSLCSEFFSKCEHTREQAEDKLYQEWISAIFSANR